MTSAMSLRNIDMMRVWQRESRERREKEEERNALSNKIETARQNSLREVARFDGDPPQTEDIAAATLLTAIFFFFLSLG